VKTVLIYGDSNVWGDTPSKRISCEQQWANILRDKLGEGYQVIQEGLCGRYAGDFDYTPRPYYNGQFCFEAIYRTASPVDIVILALGTNDLNDRYNRTVEQIVDGILWFEPKAKTTLDETETPPTFLYILPPNFTGEFRENETFDLEKRIAVNQELKVRVPNFVEINDIDLSADGLHFSPKGHEQMAAAVYEKLKIMGE
jgi:lysophospholipase L1-like esterase